MDDLKNSDLIRKLATKEEYVNSYINISNKSLLNFLNEIGYLIKEDFDTYKNIISKIVIEKERSLDIDFRDFRIYLNSEEVKSNFFTLMFLNNFELGKTLFNNFSRFLSENPYIGINNLVFHENFTRKICFTEEEYIEKNKSLLRAIKAEPNIFKKEENIIIFEDIQQKIIEEEKDIIIKKTNKINKSDLPLSRKRI